MDKSKQKEKINYVDKLDAEPRSRYLEKLSLLNGSDPYNLSDSEWSTDFNIIPPLEFPGIVSYLVCGVSAYTLEQFKCYKSLEAHMQFTNGWVQELKMFTPENCDNTAVKAKVLHSQRLGEKPLLPWIILSKSGDVVAAHCDCMAGLAESCTHVGALLFKIEAVVRIRQKPTVTGVPAYWIIPSSVEKVLPEVGYKIDYTSASARRKQLDKSIEKGTASSCQIRTCSITAGCSSTSVPTEAEISSFLEGLHQTGDKAVLLSAVPGFCKFYKDPVKPVVLPKSLRNLRNSKCDSFNELELLNYCKSVSEHVNVTEEEAGKIERETTEQHKSPYWYACRVGRITASQLHHVCTFKNDKPAISTIVNVCYPGQKKTNVPAVKWGISNEETARRLYINEAKKHHFGLTLQKAGFIINPDIPYMGASPDGIVYCECCGKGCLEIKCPYKHKEASILDASKDKNFCLMERNGMFVLRSGHPYYYQVQCQILVSRSDYCDFMVWTTADFAVLRVEPDPQFTANCTEKAKNFFDKIVLPELVAKQFTKPSKTPSLLTKRPLSLSPQKNILATPAVPKKSGFQSKKNKMLWCHCRRPEDADDMVACDNPECKTVWYHIGCVGLEQMPSCDDTWFCSVCITNPK